MRIESKGHEIRSTDDWLTYAPPKGGRRQWVEGRSAFELARAWCGDAEPAMPGELRRLLDSRPETNGMLVDCAFPEHRIRFDERSGEPRNADLAFIGRTKERTVAVTIEAKADESYGNTITATTCAALERLIAEPRSKGVDRIRDLVLSLLRPWSKGLPQVDGLHYQLLTAVAGTLAYAVTNKAGLGVVIVHEFVTSKTDDAKHRTNAHAYSDFVRRLHGGLLFDEELDGLMGPFTVPGVPLFPNAPPLLVGKITTNRRGGTQ